MLIIEGPDLVGKTTLAHECVRELNKRGFPHVYAHLSKLAASFDKVHGYIPLMHRHVVQDRFHLSRLAYGRHFKNQDVLTDNEMRWLQAKLWLQGAFTVLLLAKPDGVFLRKQWAERGRAEMYEIDGIVEVNKVYHQLYEEYQPYIDCAYQFDGKSGWPSRYTETIVDQTRP